MCFWLTRDLIKIAEKYTLCIFHYFTQKTHVNDRIYITFTARCFVSVYYEESSFSFCSAYNHRPLTGFQYLLSHSISFVMQNNMYGWHRINNLICCMYEREFMYVCVLVSSYVYEYNIVEIWDFDLIRIVCYYGHYCGRRDRL